jgi:hypothetical protein
MYNHELLLRLWNQAGWIGRAMYDAWEHAYKIVFVQSTRKISIDYLFINGKITSQQILNTFNRTYESVDWIKMAPGRLQ